MKTITLRIKQDDDCENPLENDDGMWSLHTFDYRNGNAKFDDYFEDRGSRTLPTSLDLFWKLRNGLAFVVGGMEDGYGYSYHYTERYDPLGSIRGVMIWEHSPDDMGAKTYEERRKDAKSTLETYDKWASGDCYGWIINDDEPSEDSCWGFVGRADLLASLKHDYLPHERPLRIVLLDTDTEQVVDGYDFGEGVTVVTRKEQRAHEAMIDAAEREDEGDYDRIEREVA